MSYTWTDNPTEAGVAVANMDILNDNLMYLRYAKDIVTVTCSTAAATAAKTATISGLTIADDVHFYLKMENANTSSSITLNVNGAGDWNIYDLKGNQITGTMFSNSVNEQFLFKADKTNTRFVLVAKVSNNIWTSSNYASGTAAIVTVPTYIDLTKCMVQVMLKCLTAQGGYSVGDIAPFNWSSGGDSNWNGACIDFANRTVSAMPGNTLFIPTKNSSGYFYGTAANWAFVFKILY